MDEVYVSTDVESDGPIPGPNSMLSLGAAAFTLRDGMLSTFSANLFELPGSAPDPVTKAEFWDKNPEAWAACRKDPVEPLAAMTSYVDWVRSMPGKPVFVGYPATYDFMFVYWYIVRHGLVSPFSFSALDIKSFTMAVLGRPFRESTKRNMPRRWFPESPHTHVAVDDAVEQGELFMNILRESRQRRAGGS